MREMEPELSATVYNTIDTIYDNTQMVNGTI